MKVEQQNTKLVFAQNSIKSSAAVESSSSTTIVMDDLRSLWVTTVDSEQRRAMCLQNRFFGLQLSDRKHHRKLYFTSYDQMVAAANFLVLRTQGFATRLDLYKRISLIPKQSVVDSWVVENQITGKMLIMK